MTFAVRVPASTSNLGAGFDCLGLALDLWLEAKLEPGVGDPAYAGTLADLDCEHDVLFQQIAASCLVDRFRLTVQSDIPISRGLGSSAAARVAGLALAQLARGITLDRTAIFATAAREERHPDNAGPAVYGGLVLAARSPTRLTLHRDIAVALAVPNDLVETAAARAILPDQISRETAVSQAARAAALIVGLQTGDGDLIGFGMEDQIAVPHRRGLIPGFEQAVSAGREAGAYGVTTSGSGSTLLALTPAARAQDAAAAMATALRDAGNPAESLTPVVSEQGVTVLSDSEQQAVRKTVRSEK